VRTDPPGSRLTTVADAFLRPKLATTARCIAIGGSAAGIAPRSIGGALLRAADALSIQARWLDDDPDEARDSDTALWIVDLGRPSVASLRRLPPPQAGQGPQLLLWGLGEEPPSLHDLYVFELWSWSLAAASTRCIVPERGAGRAGWEFPRRGLAAPMLCWPRREAALGALSLGILQSALSAPGPAGGARTLQAPSS
jgi:hypothetical protein